MLTTTEIAQKYKVSARHIRHLIATGQLQAVRFGRVYRVDPKDLAAYLERSK